MTPVFDVKNKSAIEAEARAWIVQLDGRAPSREDLAALREWAARSPQHYATLREMAQMWGELDQLAALEPMIVAAANARQTGQRRRWTPAVAGAALAFSLVAAIAAAALLFVMQPRQDQSVLYATALGEQREIVLPDESVMRLNTNTTVEVMYERRTRRIRVVQGEALFDVASNADRPFVVSAHESAVRAVGTVFAVRLDPDQIEVTVNEGMVALIAQARTREIMETGVTAMISAGNSAIVAGDNYSMRVLSAAEMNQKLAWSRGFLVFRGEPLSQVLAEIGRYADLHFEIADPALAAEPIGGRVPISDPEALVEALGPTFNIDVERDGDVVRLSRRTAN